MTRMRSSNSWKVVVTTKKQKVRVKVGNKLMRKLSKKTQIPHRQLPHLRASNYKRAKNYKQSTFLK